MATEYLCQANGESVTLSAAEDADGLVLADEAGEHRIQIHPSRNSIRSATIDNRQVEFGIVCDGDTYHILIDGIDYAVRVADARFEKLMALGSAGGAAGGAAHVKAPIPGLIMRILVEPGQAVSRDQPVLILDAMKLENEILAPRDGVVSRVAVTPGQAVEKDELLLEIEAPEQAT